jgi:hypothetical protein
MRREVGNAFFVFIAAAASGLPKVAAERLLDGASKARDEGGRI